MSKNGFLNIIGGLLGFETPEKKRKRAFTDKINQLTEEVKAFKVNLVSTQQKEFELLSLKVDVLQKMRRRKPKVLRLSNIYHEPLFVSIEDLVSRSSEDVALKIFSRDGVYSYWIRPDYVSIWNGSNFWGNLLPDGRFIYKNNKAVGQIKANNQSERLEIHVSNELQAAIDLSHEEIKESTRALSYAYFNTESTYELSRILILFILSNPTASFKLNL